MCGMCFLLIFLFVYSKKILSVSVSCSAKATPHPTTAIFEGKRTSSTAQLHPLVTLLPDVANSLAT